MSSTATTATTGVYVPIHRRGGSSPPKATVALSPDTEHMHMPASPGSSVSSMSEDSWKSSLGSPTSNAITMRLPIYSIHDLLSLSDSPLASLSKEKREEIREIVPEVYMNRRQRHARVTREHHREGSGVVPVKAKVRVEPSPSRDGGHGYERKLKRQDEWQDNHEKKVLAQVQNTTSRRSLHDDSSKSTVPLQSKSESQTQLPATQRRSRRSVDRRGRRAPNSGFNFRAGVTADELSWRRGGLGVANPVWSSQRMGVVLPPQ